MVNLLALQMLDEDWKANMPMKYLREILVDRTQVSGTRLWPVIYFLYKLTMLCDHWEVKGRTRYKFGTVDN